MLKKIAVLMVLKLNLSESGKKRLRNCSSSELLLKNTGLQIEKEIK
jgi:hypothetical protein